MFDDLPGKGKPLTLSQNLYSADRELAHNILRENDIQPAWIMQRKHLLAEQQSLRTNINQTWQWHHQALTQATSKETRGKLVISWDDACQHWQTQIIKLNKEIQDFNLKRPIAHLEIYKLTLEGELKRVGAPRWLKL